MLQCVCNNVRERGTYVWCEKGQAWRVKLCACVSLTMRFHLFNDLMWTGFNETGAVSSLAAESPQADYLINGGAARDGTQYTSSQTQTLTDIQICKYQWESVYLSFFLWSSNDEPTCETG